MNLGFRYFLSSQHCVLEIFDRAVVVSLGVWELGEVLDTLAISPLSSLFSKKLFLAGFSQYV